MELLSIGSDAKTPKGEKHNVLTAICYLAPVDLAGVGNVCGHASEACAADCIFYAGHGETKQVQQVRIDRTRLFMLDRSTFMTRLLFELARFERKADKAGMLGAVRLNGTSDVKWEGIKVRVNGEIVADNIMQLFPRLQFYDYTAWPYERRPLERLPLNYDITYSRKEKREREVITNLANYRRVAVVFHTRKGQPLPRTYNSFEVIDGDDSDCRFLDDTNVIVGLRAKGRGRKDTTGFVVPVCATCGEVADHSHN